MKAISWLSKLLEPAISLLILVVLLSFTLQVFFQLPYAGFDFSDGRVYIITNQSPDSDPLLLGDRLIEVGGIAIADFENDLRITLFENVTAGDIVPLVVERDGEILNIDWVFAGFTAERALGRLNSQWWLPYIFWIAGTAALLFIRPKDRRWRLFIAFTYLTAIWLGAGSGPSHQHLGVSALVLASGLWLSVPVYLHFHWEFPQSLAKLPAWIWGTLYTGAAFLAVLEWLQISPIDSNFLGAVLAFGGSLILLAVHFLVRQEERQDLLILFAGALLPLLPIFIISLLQYLDYEPLIFAQGGIFLALPAIPGAYFFVMFRRQYEDLQPRINRVARLFVMAVFIGVLFLAVLSIVEVRINLAQSTEILGLLFIFMAVGIGALAMYPFVALPALAQSSVQIAQPYKFQLRANRLAAWYLFFAMLFLIFTGLLFFLENQFEFPGETTVLGVLAGLTIGIITAAGFGSFQKMVDRRLLGIPLPPSDLLPTYAARITTSLDRQSLVHILRDEILPSLLIRQSALVRLPDTRSVDVLYYSGVVLPKQTTAGQLREWLPDHNPARPPDDPGEPSNDFSWAKVILSLKVQERVIGLWLLGSRDPDDFYAVSELSVLEAIANQTAIALVNIEQADKLHTLFQADIERQDAERSRIARGLHDMVLNRLALLASLDANQPNSQQFQRDLQEVTDYLREVISDLRPAMLNYGLYLGLEELCEQLNDRGRNGTVIKNQLAPSQVRLDEKVEENLYWIVHQACENAIKHAGGSQVTISGRLAPESVRLYVEDDGAGFTHEGALDFTALLAGRHFGLVGMYERAELIGARLQINSTPGVGTRVQVELAPGDGQ